MTNRMEEIKARKEKLASAYEWIRAPDYADEFTTKDLVEWLNIRPSGTILRATNDVDFLLSRCASLESLVRELAKGVVAVRDLMAESGGVYGLHLNGDPSPWHELVEGGFFEAWLIDYSAAETTLSHPIVSELIGEKEAGRNV